MNSERLLKYWVDQFVIGVEEHRYEYLFAGVLVDSAAAHYLLPTSGEPIPRVAA